MQRLAESRASCVVARPGQSLHTVRVRAHTHTHAHMLRPRGTALVIPSALPFCSSCSQPPWRDADYTTAHYDAHVVGSNLVVDVEWNTDFEWYFGQSPSGNLSAVVLGNMPRMCRPPYTASVTVDAQNGTAQLVVPIPSELLTCSASEPTKTGYLMIQLDWVSAWAGGREREAAPRSSACRWLIPG